MSRNRVKASSRLNHDNQPFAADAALPRSVRGPVDFSHGFQR